MERNKTKKKEKGYPDLVFRMEEVTFGEEARNSMDKKRRTDERQDILLFICALLNSGGGILCAGIANKGYSYDKDALGEDLEDGLNKLLNPVPLQNVVTIAQHLDELRFFVLSWHSTGRQAGLSTLNSGLLKRSGTSVLPISAEDVVSYFLRRQKQEQDTGDERLYDKARQLYEEKFPVCLNQSLDFGENENVEFKSFGSEKKLLQRLKEILPRYISAFANTRGGFFFVGIDDKSKKVVGCGEGMNPAELKKKIQELCDKARDRAFHMNNCTSRNSWYPEVNVIQVTTAPAVPAYLIVIKIPQFCCAVFEKDPESWEIDGDELTQLQCRVWFEKMQLLSSGGQLVASTLNQQHQRPTMRSTRGDRISLDPILIGPTKICSELFRNLPNIQTILSNLSESGLLIVSRSWALDINQPRNKAVICKVLLIKPGEYPRLFFVVPNESDDLWEYAIETAFTLKQKLVNLGRYARRICVIPHLICYETGHVLDNTVVSSLRYPKSYTMGISKIGALLCSLDTVVLSLTLPQNEGLSSEKMKQIINPYHCEPKNILSICRARFDLQVWEASSDVQNMMVDEGQNLCEEDGDRRVTVQEQAAHRSDFSVNLCRLITSLPSTVHHVFAKIKNQLTGTLKCRKQKHLKFMLHTHSHSGFSEIIKKVEELLETGSSPRDIAVLFEAQSHPDLPSLRRMELSFPHGNVEDNDSDVVVLDSLHRFFSLKRNIVILVLNRKSPITPSLLLTALSKARTSFYVITPTATDGICKVDRCRSSQVRLHYA